MVYRMIYNHDCDLKLQYEIKRAWEKHIFIASLNYLKNANIFSDDTLSVVRHLGFSLHMNLQYGYVTMAS